MDGRCIIVGAGDFYGFHSMPAPGDYLIAADAGYRWCTQQQVIPDLVVGDFDSLKNAPDHPNIIRLPVEKDDTDTLAAIRLGLEKGYRQFELYGVTGGRVDHTIANLQCLLFLHRHGARGTMYGNGIVYRGICCETVSFPASARGGFSLFCLDGTARGVTIRGMKYETTDAVITSDYPVGCSNSFRGIPSSVTVEDGSLIAIYSEKVECDHADL